MLPTILMLARECVVGVNRIAAEKETKRHGWNFYQENRDTPNTEELVQLEPTSTTIIALSPCET